MNYQLTFTIIFIFVINSYGQQDELLLKGQVLEFENSIVGAHLYNANKFQGTSSTNEGNFTINVRLNDTLVISHVKYFTVKIAVDQKVLNQNPFIIHLKEKTNQLDTVNILNHNLTKNLKFDSNSRHRTVNKDSLNIDFQRFAKMPSMKDYNVNREVPPMVIVDPAGGSAVGTTVSIGFKLKDVELRRELRTKRNFPKEIISNFGVTYFTETLKIPKDKVYHFITYFEERNIMQLYKKNELIKILTIFEEESNVYLKIKK
jgi:hypothetical protein